MTEPTRTDVITHLMDMKQDIGEMKGVLNTVVEVHCDAIEAVEKDVAVLKKWKVAVVAGATTFAGLFGMSLKL